MNTALYYWRSESAALAACLSSQVVQFHTRTVIGQLGLPRRIGLENGGTKFTRPVSSKTRQGYSSWLYDEGLSNCRLYYNSSVSSP